MRDRGRGAPLALRVSRTRPIAPRGDCGIFERSGSSSRNPRMCRCRRACQVKYDSVPVADRGGLGMRAPQALRLPSAVEGGLRPPA